jgi:hypothetical protein
MNNWSIGIAEAQEQKEFRFISTRCARYGHRSLNIDERSKCATLGIMKIGANITYSGTTNRTAANFDVVSVCNGLVPNFRLHFITKITRNTVLPKDVAYTDIQDAKHRINDLGIDALLIFNGSVNNWGGEPDKNAIEIWRFIQNFKGRVFYLHTDGVMRLHQIYDSTFEKRGWDRWWPKDQVYVTRDDIVYLTQARSISRITSLIKKGNSIPIKPENIVYFPIQEAGLLSKPKFRTERNIEWDLVYGGGLRNGRRHDQLVKWYFGHDELNVRLFGNIALEKFAVPKDGHNPSFGGPIANSLFISTMRKGLATVHIVDDWYANHWVTLRFYEAMQAGTIPFIDNAADHKHLLYYPGSVIEDFLYVKKKSDVVDRIKLIKREDCASEVVDLCRDAVRMRWDRDRYLDLLKTTILKKL